MFTVEDEIDELHKELGRWRRREAEQLVGLDRTRLNIRILERQLAELREQQRQEDERA